MEFQTVYVVTDNLSQTRASALWVVLPVVAVLVVCAAARPRDRRPPPAERPKWMPVFVAAVALGLAALSVIPAVVPRMFEADDAVARYEAGEYATLVGRVDRVERVRGRGANFRLHVGERTFRYRHDRERGRMRDELGVHLRDTIERLPAVLHGKTVRVRHVGDQILQLEVAGGS